MKKILAILKIITGANGQLTVNFTENCPDYKECSGRII